MNSSSKLKAAILVISETASRDASTDKCIPVLEEVFASDGNDQWNVVQKHIVPDDVLEIQRTVKQWTDSDDSVNLVITSGGTGFAVKDNTPEVDLGHQSQSLKSLMLKRQSHRLFTAMLQA